MNNHNLSNTGTLKRKRGMLIACLVLILTVGTGIFLVVHHSQRQTEAGNHYQMTGGTDTSPEGNGTALYPTETENPTQADRAEADLEGNDGYDYQTEIENPTQAIEGTYTSPEETEFAVYPTETENPTQANGADTEIESDSDDVYQDEAETPAETGRTVVDFDGNEVLDYDIVLSDEIVENVEYARAVLLDRMNRLGLIPSLDASTNEGWARILADIESGELQPFGKIHEDGALEIFNLQERFANEERGEAVRLETSVYIGSEHVVTGIFNSNR
jgi:hypothetical protein